MVGGLMQRTWALKKDPPYHYHRCPVCHTHETCVMKCTIVDEETVSDGYGHYVRRWGSHAPCDLCKLRVRNARERTPTQWREAWRHHAPSKIVATLHNWKWHDLITDEELREWLATEPK
jgi:hypothetical protein